MGNDFSNLSEMDACCTGSRHPTRGNPGDFRDAIADPAQDRHRLFHLIESGQHMMLDAFLQRKYGMIDINTVNEKGETPLHVAAKLGYLGCCKSLVANGADVTLKDWTNKDPVEVARSTGHNFCEAFLRARMEAVKPREKQRTVPLATAEQNSNNNTPRENGNTPRQENVDDDHEEAPAKALYGYTANPSPPFPPDKRMEFTLFENEKLVLLEVRPDGWAIVRKKNGKKQGYVPGNYITVDGKNPLFDDEGNATGHHGPHEEKFRHLGGDIRSHRRRSSEHVSHVSHSDANHVTRKH